jgi:hypothetical protein
MAGELCFVSKCQDHRTTGEAKAGERKTGRPNTTVIPALYSLMFDVDELCIELVIGIRISALEIKAWANFVDPFVHFFPHEAYSYLQTPNSISSVGS